jgi:homoserine O-acetyltransferase
MARVYAGWGFSQQFYRERVYEREPLGHGSLEDFLVGFWEGLFIKRDANNLLAMLWTWQNADIGATPGFAGVEEALAAIRMPAIVMPAQQDLYFPPEDNEWEVSHLPNAELRVIPGAWGHFAGGGLNPVDTKFIDDALKELLAKDA